MPTTCLKIQGEEGRGKKTLGNNVEHLVRLAHVWKKPFTWIVAAVVARQSSVTITVSPHEGPVIRTLAL